MTKYRVKLNVTLRGAEEHISGAIFTGTIDELPVDIANAVREKKDYIEVTELISAEEQTALDEVTTKPFNVIPELQTIIDCLKEDNVKLVDENAGLKAANVGLVEDTTIALGNFDALNEPSAKLVTDNAALQSEVDELKAEILELKKPVDANTDKQDESVPSSDEKTTDAKKEGKTTSEKKKTVKRRTRASRTSSKSALKSKE